MKIPKAVVTVLLIATLITSYASVHTILAAMFWKGSYVDYASSGVPDFDQKQDGWINPRTGTWSWCGPTAVADSLWWMDSRFETSNTPPPTINDTFPLVQSYNSAWDDHDLRNVQPFIQTLSQYMDTDGIRTGDKHNGTNVVDMAQGILNYIKDHGLDSKFNVKMVKMPTFDYIDKEVGRCEDTILLLGFWQLQGSNWVRVGGHFVTVPGIDFAGNLIAFSDPFTDNAEPLPHGGGGPGQVLPAPHPHPPVPPDTVHNDALYVSHDTYNVMLGSPSPGGPQLGIYYEPYDLTGLVSNMQGQNCPGEFGGQQGSYVPGLPISTEVEYGVFISPMPQMYWKPGYPDYAPSGMPDVDERQVGTYNWTSMNTWSHCAPVAVANSLWWFDSKFETNLIPPPAIVDNFRLVSSYATMGPFWDDHDPLNVPFLVEHLAYLMDTDGQRTHWNLPRVGTDVTDMQTGIAQYLSWTGINPIGDVNCDGVVDNTDLGIVVAANNTAPPVVGWDMTADIYPVTLGWPVPGKADSIVNQSDIDLVKAHMGQTGMFYEHTVPRPEFDFIEAEVEKCEDVVLTLGFWTFNGGIWTRLNYPGEPYPSTGTYGHAVTVAGVNSTTFQIAISDPAFDAFENRLITDGRVPVAHLHTQPEPPYTTHNNASLVSQDIYNVAPLPPVPPCPGGNWAIMGYPPSGAPVGLFAVIENAVVVSPVHDIAVTNVSAFRGRTVLFQGFSANVTVTVENHGGYPETFNVTVYANMTATANVTKIGKLINVALNSGSITSLTCMWNATGFAKWNATTGFGNYTLIACADPVAGETHTEDNNFTGGCMLVTMVGDLVGKTGVPDGTCSTLDISVAAKCFGGYPGCPPPLMWNVNCDVTGINLIPDDKIGIIDISVVAKQFGKSDP